jgi:hypothetical protein
MLGYIDPSCITFRINADLCCSWPIQLKLNLVSQMDEFELAPGIHVKNGIFGHALPPWLRQGA